MNREELQQLAEIRLSDAKALLATGANNTGAYYLAGYAVECALKAVIAKDQGQYRYPDFSEPSFKKENYFTHNIVSLVKIAGLTDDLASERITNYDLGASWLVVEEWSEQTRYETTRARTDTQELVDAIADPLNGVLQWIKQLW